MQALCDCHNPDLVHLDRLADDIGGCSQFLLVKSLRRWLVAGSDGVLKSGTGTLVLTAVSSFGGGTTVNAGALELRGASGGTSLINGAITVHTGATLSLTNGDGTGFGWNNTISNLIINGGNVTMHPTARRPRQSGATGLPGHALRNAAAGAATLLQPSFDSSAFLPVAGVILFESTTFSSRH